MAMMRGLLFLSLVAACACLSSQDLSLVGSDDNAAAGEQGVGHAPTVLYLSDALLAEQAQAGTNASAPAVTPRPLVLLLHAKCQTAAQIEAELHFRDLVDSMDFILVEAEAERKSGFCAQCTYSGGLLGTRYGCQTWKTEPSVVNATEPDDALYLKVTVEAISQVYPVAPGMVYVAGLENGGAMAYRLACEYPDMIAGVMSFGGSMTADAECAALVNGTGSPVSVLHVAGTQDSVPYQGGRFTGEQFLSAMDAVAQWSEYNGCATNATTEGEGVRVKREGLVLNKRPDTTVTHVGEDCAFGAETTVWVVDGLKADGAEDGDLIEDFNAVAIQWFFNHSLPAAATEGGAGAGSNLAITTEVGVVVPPEEEAEAPAEEASTSSTSSSSEPAEEADEQRVTGMGGAAGAGATTGEGEDFILPGEDEKETRAGQTNGGDDEDGDAEPAGTDDAGSPTSVDDAVLVSPEATDATADTTTGTTTGTTADTTTGTTTGTTNGTDEEEAYLRGPQAVSATARTSQICAVLAAVVTLLTMC